MNEEEKSIRSATDLLLRRLPSSQLEKNLEMMVTILKPKITSDICKIVGFPLKIEKDREVGKEYIKCEYNRKGDSYRSPWSNKYYPEIKDSYIPTDDLREFEIEANLIFEKYYEEYQELSVSSVYCWELENKRGYGCSVLSKKEFEGRDKEKGVWESINVLEMYIDDMEYIEYNLNTSVRISLGYKSGGKDNLICGQVEEFKKEKFKLKDKILNIVNIGNMIQRQENEIKTKFDCFDKPREVIRNLRDVISKDERKRMVENIFQTEFLYNTLKRKR